MASPRLVTGPAKGLKQAYLQLHLSDHTDANCKPIATKLGGYVRGRLSRRSSREVEKHLRNCAECTAAYADLSAINHSLRGALAPVMLGTGAAGYLAATHATATTTAAVAQAGLPSATAPARASQPRGRRSGRDSRARAGSRSRRASAR